MEIRDPIHGQIHIINEEILIIKNVAFQRLRNIKQLGLSEYIFPGATHNRYLHSLGVMAIGSRAFHRIFKNLHFSSEIERLHISLRLACLLHDIGHAPLSHATEQVMPCVSKLGLEKRFYNGEQRKATHEDYTIKLIVDGSLTYAFRPLEQKFGVDYNSVAELISGKTSNPEYFTINNINYFPILHQLVSSEIDCDRMDYLLRDSYFCGVSYGTFDLDWILDNLKICLIDNHAYLGLTERALSTFDDFLLGRFHMFLMVYFHYKAVCLEKLLSKFFETSPTEYSIPASTDEYLQHDDHFILKILKNSDNIYAKKLLLNEIPEKIFEGFGPSHLPLIDELEKYLKQNTIEYIKCSSKGRLSKYYQEGENKTIFPMKVIRQYHQQESYLDIEKATDLFKKYSEAHSVNRIHLDLDQINPVHKKSILNIISNYRIINEGKSSPQRTPIL